MKVFRFALSAAAAMAAALVMVAPAAAAPAGANILVTNLTDDVVAANWDSMVFDVGRSPLRRVPMMEPLRGTAAHVGSVIDQSDSVAALLATLGS